MRRFLPALALCLFALPASAMEFGMPVRCNYGTDCFVQNYVDTAPGKKRRDHRCRHLTYDGHDGTDIRLPDFTWLEKNIPVIAAADGKVLNIRDKMKDVNVKDINIETIKNVKCGNGVMLDHGDGWMSQYCHMKRGSIAVKPGQRVKKGEVLGFVGLSGNTEFPHLHFNVFHEKQRLDPFTGQRPEAGCHTAAQGSLWDGETQALLTYIPTAILSAGVAERNLNTADIEAARHGKFSATEIPGTASAVVIWADLMGVSAGDTLAVNIVDPQGKVRQLSNKVPRDLAASFQFMGLKNTGSNLPPGDYHATITLTTTDKAILTRKLDFTLR